MRRGNGVLVVLVLGLMLSGCAGTAQYRSLSGEVIETSEQMAVIMANRDMYVAKQNTVKAAFEAADSPEDAVGAAVLGVQEVAQIQRPKTLDERLLPWASMLLPLVNGWIGGGQNTMGENGIMIDGTGNSVSVVSGNTLTDSQNYVQMTPTTTYSINTQTNTEESANDGNYTYQPDNSTGDNSTPAVYETTPTTTDTTAEVAP